MALQHRYKVDAVTLHIAQQHLALGVSFHLVAQRFVALAVRQSIAAAELLNSSGETLASDATLAAVSSDADATFKSAVSTLLGGKSSDEREQRALLLLDEPLCLFAAAIDTRAGLWRRNGNVMSLQLLNWGGQFRSSLKYLDVLACQIAMVKKIICAIFFFRL